MSMIQTGAMGLRAKARRARKGDVVSMTRDTNQELVLYVKDYDILFYELVRWQPKDRLALDHITGCLGGQFDLDGVEEAYVSDDGRHFRFPHHGNRLVPIIAFAGNCITATVVDLAGAGFRVAGPKGKERLVYDEPQTSDSYGATLEGC